MQVVASGEDVEVGVIAVAAVKGYCYDAELVSVIMANRIHVPLLEAHTINNLLTHYMAYSGYYGAGVPVQPEKVREITQVLERWLISKLT